MFKYVKILVVVMKNISKLSYFLSFCTEIYHNIKFFTLLAVKNLLSHRVGTFVAALYFTDLKDMGLNPVKIKFFFLHYTPETEVLRDI